MFNHQCGVHVSIDGIAALTLPFSIVQRKRVIDKPAFKVRLAGWKVSIRSRALCAALRCTYAHAGVLVHSAGGAERYRQS